MKYGITVPFAPARTAAGLAQLAEASGWDGFFVPDACWAVDPFVTLTAAAMLTTRIRLGTLVLALPRAVPWKLASEAASLDNLSAGRLTLGLGAGAVWMGYAAFPDEVVDARARAELMDEGLDVLDLLFAGKPADYAGRRRRLKLTAMDEMHYPPPPFQRPRVPLWVVGAWPRQASMRRVLRCDGWIAAEIDPQGRVAAPSPAAVAAGAAFLAGHGAFDILVEGRTFDLSPAQKSEAVSLMAAAGATWWCESLWGLPPERWEELIRQGPPRIIP